ncbi:MAG: M14 family metallopeptidase [Acidobacteriota bacterium]
MRPILVMLAAVCAVQGQSTFEFWPGSSYDPAIPTVEKVLGYKPGERISSHANLMRYMDALAAAAPTRMKLFEYAKSWEGRKLVYAAIGSEANIRRLPEIQAAMKKLSDPRSTSEADAKRLMQSLPAVVWLGYGVHGNEISSPDAALLTAYHLIAARKEPTADAILANTLVLIDPTQNPDGRDRFVHHFEQSEGLEPQASPVALEHIEPWLNGRTNHYHFDLNRDWLSITQPETRGRIRTLLEWFPLVFVDLHEMGADGTYYFAPEAVPYNPHLTKDQKSSLEWFGKNNAKWFDQFGFSYFTREVYDAFYPGYGASWPAYYGGIAMTYEQASARGLLMRKSDGTEFTFRDTVRQHFVASLSTCETAARQRQQLLDNFWRYRVTAIEEGKSEPVREYILVRRTGFTPLVTGPVTPQSSGAGFAEGDGAMTDRLARLLADQGIEVDRATAEFTNGGKTYPTGSYRIKLAQPAKRMIRTFLDASVPMNDEFLKEQARLREKRLPDEIYDVSAWSLPLQFNVETVAANAESQGAFTRVPREEKVLGIAPGARATVAYLVPWNTAGARLLTAALRAGLNVYSSDKSITQAGRVFPRGTLIFKVKENPLVLHEALARMARESGAEAVPTNTGWVEDGVNFGSRFVNAMKAPTVAIAWDAPVASGSAGHTRFVLERQYGYPTIPVRITSLVTADLNKFQVIILPDGPYGSAMPSALIARLRDFVRAGGTLIGIGGALNWLSDPKVALLAVQRETQPRDSTTKKESAEATVPGKLLAKEEDFRKAIAPETEAPDATAGFIAKATLDGDHWATAGAQRTVQAVVSGNDIYTPIKLDSGINTAVFEGPGEVLASGYLWDAFKKQLAFKPLMMVQRTGRGHVIAFTADPNFRAYVDGMNILFLNAVFRGPSHSR